MSPINNPDVQVFPSSDPQTESSISVSYTTPLRFLITSNSTPTSTGQGYYYSLNGGATWAGSINYPNNNPNFGDPVSLHDNAGNTFDVTLRSPSGIGMVTSGDYGVTWGPYVNIDPDNSSGDDKEMGHVDRKSGSPYENQVYVVFTHPEESLIIDRNGELLKTCETDSVLIHDLPLDNLRKTRQAVVNRRPETYREPASP